MGDVRVLQASCPVCRRRLRVRVEITARAGCRVTILRRSGPCAAHPLDVFQEKEVKRVTLHLAGFHREAQGYE